MHINTRHLRMMSDNLLDLSGLRCLPSQFPTLSLQQYCYPNPYGAVTQVKKSMSVPCSPTDSCSSRISDSVLSRASAKPTHCIMCFKRAEVLHYGVPSCSTCKTFFRRSLMNERELHCKQKEECTKPPGYWSDPSVAQRAGQCSWCRLARFVSLGMNPCAVAPRDGRDLLEYPNVAKLFETTRERPGYGVPEILQAYKRLRTAHLSDELENFFWSVRRCDTKHRQLRTSHFNPKPRSRFNWGLEEHLKQPIEMRKDIQELIWAKFEPEKQPVFIIKKEEPPSDDDFDEIPAVKGCDRRRTLPLFALQKNWEFVDTICAIEYVKFFISTFDLSLDSADQLAILRGSAIQLCLLEMSHFSWSAGFDTITFPDGTRQRMDSCAHSTSDVLLLKIASLSLTRSELAVMKGLIVCKADGVSPRGREALEGLTLQLSRILTSLCMGRRGEKTGIARFTAIVDLFHAVEVQKSKEIQQHVIEYLDKTEPKVMRDLYLCE